MNYDSDEKIIKSEGRMNQTPKTIQIFLPGGDPRGIRVAEITTRIVQVVEVPRSLLPQFVQMPESDQVGIYFLIGESEEGELKVYIGQTGELGKRLRQHNTDPKKDFWERALVMVSRTNSLTQTHAQFLEWHCIQVARQAGRFRDDNGNSGSKPYTPPPLEADCLEIFETGQILLSTLGYPVFDPAVRPSDDPQDEVTFYCRSAGCEGRGRYTPEGLVVFKDSVGRSECVPSVVGTPVERERNRLIANGVIREEGEKLIFTRDHIFRAPSAASAVLLGRHSNGWIEWKNEKGETLDGVVRQPE